MPDPSTPSRRFQFRLRTLLIGVTLLAALSASVLWVVKDRNSLIQERDRAIRERDDALDRLNGPAISSIVLRRTDTGQLEIEIPAGTPPKEIEKVKRMYGGAIIKLTPSAPNLP
jgi:hypothetical protein